jgi:predicted aldo/keto reductase-like oxidoreductase
MEYRSFPKVPGVPISTLGFGCMRLPTIGGEFSRVDEEAATRLLHDAIRAGVNYIDTAYPYHGGHSERVVARALAGGRRGTVQLATKLPIWLVKAERDWEAFLDEQLARLQTDRIDFYLLHGLDAGRWETLLALRGLPAMERARADGRIGHIGFSFHDSLDVFKRIIDGYDWEFCQIQLNLLDEGYQAGLEGLRYASARQVGVVVMEPLRGGALAQAPPEVARIWARSGSGRSPAQWALRWVLGQPGVVTALSGMNASAQLAENVQAADVAPPLNAGELALVDEVRRFYEARIVVPCTTCGYCQPCPAGVDIPNVLSLHNAAAMFGSKAQPAMVYRLFVLGQHAGADLCTECHDCESKCPQHIEIAERLAEAHRYLTA